MIYCSLSSILIKVIKEEKVMETGIKVGNDLKAESLTAVGDLITQVFKSAADYRMEQSAVIKALDVLCHLCEVKYAAVQDCMVNGDRKVVITDVFGENKAGE